MHSREDPRKKDLEKKVFQVAEEFGLDIEGELDEIGIEYLGTYVNARTVPDGSRLKVEFDSQRFFNRTERQQERTILHELIHVKQFNNSLGDWTREEFGASEEFAEELEDTIWEDVKSIEGETELILSNLFPELGSSYPYELEAKEREMEEHKFDVDTELTREVDEMADEIMEEYREIENVEIEDDIYVEEGSIGGQDYSVAMAGEGLENPAEKAEDYIKERVEEYLVAEHERSSYSGNESGAEEQVSTDSLAGDPLNAEYKI